MLTTSMQHLTGELQGDAEKYAAQARELQYRLEVEQQKSARLRRDQQVNNVCFCMLGEFRES